MERAVVNEDSGADSGGSAARMDAASGSEDECASETRLDVEAEVVIETGGVEGVEDAER
jgi:hypothetical protein